MAAKQPHLFAHRPSRRKTVESVTTLFFRLATYCVILAAGYIFVDIIANGSKAVFTTKAPFINVAFLTEKPQTLHVFEPKEPYAAIQANNRKILSLNSKIAALGKDDQQSAQDYQDEIVALQAEIETLDIARKADRLMYSDSEYRALDNPPNKKNYAYATYAYSGGGIGPAIIGTCLLVAGSIAIALTSAYCVPST